MPRVVPSQVRAFIDTLPLRTMSDEGVSLNQVGSAKLSALLDLLYEIPEELLTMDTDHYASFITAKAQIRDILTIWTSNRNAGHPLTPTPFHASTDPVGRIRAALGQCVDESPTPGTAELSFITDADFRTNLRNDIGAINRALSNGEWKGATVLAGSAIEALLLWDLQNRRSASISSAITALVASHTFTPAPPANLEDWGLHHYTEVAAHLGIIVPETAIEVRLAKNFRNLIHPGRAQRLGQKCDRGTALASVAALEHVVRDLS